MNLPAIKRKSLVNLTPLIDMVFILLIFFMLASNFVEWNYIELGVGESEELLVDYDQASIIQIAENHVFYLNEAALPLDTIISKVRNRVRSDINHPIVVQPSASTKLQAMVNVLDQLQNFSGHNISVARPEEERASQ